MADTFTRTPRERTEQINNLISSGGSMYLSFGRSVSLQWLTWFLEMSPHLSRLEIRVGFSELLLGIHDEGTYRERDRDRDRDRETEIEWSAQGSDMVLCQKCSAVHGMTIDYEAAVWTGQLIITSCHVMS
mgnify:FL=1